MRPLLLLLIVTSLLCAANSDYTTGESLLRSPKIQTGFTYSGGNSGSLIFYRGLGVGIKERVQFTLTPWHLISGAIKINLISTGDPDLWCNAAVSLYFGGTGYAFWDMMDSNYYTNQFVGISLGTEQSYPKGSSMELIFSPNLCHENYVRESYYVDSSDFREARRLNINAPIGFAWNWGRGARYYVSGALVLRGRIWHEYYGRAGMLMKPHASFQWGINWGPSFVKRRRAKRSSNNRY